jgi:hypothetical protein
VKLIAIRLSVDRDALLPSNGGPLSYDRSEIACQGLLSGAPALGQRTQMAVWRQGGTGGFANTAVDMALRLDDARASPTCPQPQQQLRAA